MLRQIWGYHSGVAEDQVLWDVALCPTPWVNSTGTSWTVDAEDESTTVSSNVGRLRLKSDGTRAESRFRLSAKRTSPFKTAGVSVQSTTGSRCVSISSSNAGYTKFRGSVKSTGYPLHSPVSPSLPLPASPCAIAFQLDFNCRLADRA